MTANELKIKSIQYRKEILQYIKHANAGHTGGSLSCIDILNVLYNRVLRVSPENITTPTRDRYIQSKGHSVEALYVVLADCGFFPKSELLTLGRYKSHFVGHPTRKIPGIEHNTGALGHGLSFAAGVALSGKKEKADYKVFTLLGDGELVEGSNWEAMLFAAHYQLDNLVAIIDHNKLQITDSVEKVCNIYPLEEKFRAFGWAIHQVDGNSINELCTVFDQLPFESGKPNMIIANTTKGKGISFMEGMKNWHHKVPSDEQLAKGLEELDGALKLIF